MQSTLAPSVRSLRSGIRQNSLVCYLSSRNSGESHYESSSFGPTCDAKRKAANRFRLAALASILHCFADFLAATHAVAAIVAKVAVPVPYRDAAAVVAAWCIDLEASELVPLVAAVR